MCVKNEKAAAGIEFLVDGAPAQSCTCQFCGCQMKQSEKLVVCSKCDTPHHDECYQDNRGCTTFACKGSTPIPARLENGRIAVDARYNACAEAVYKALDAIMRNACFMSIPADIGSLLRDEGLVSAISEKERAVLESEVSMTHRVKEQAAKYQREISRMKLRRFWANLFSFNFFKCDIVKHDGHTEYFFGCDFFKLDGNKEYDSVRDGLESRKAELRRLNALKNDLEQYASTGTGYVKLTDAGARLLERMYDLRHSLQVPYADFVQKMM